MIKPKILVTGSTGKTGGKLWGHRRPLCMQDEHLKIAHASQMRLQAPDGGNFATAQLETPGPRFLSPTSVHHLHVTGVDLTPDFIAVSNYLAARVGLEVPQMPFKSQNRKGTK